MIPWQVRAVRARLARRCVRCGDEHAGPSQACRGCTSYEVDRKADRRDDRQAAGLCRCGGARVKDSQQCERCRRAEWFRWAKSREQPGGPR